MLPEDSWRPFGNNSSESSILYNIKHTWHYLAAAFATAVLLMTYPRPHKLPVNKSNQRVPCLARDGRSATWQQVSLDLALPLRQYWCGAHNERCAASVHHLNCRFPPLAGAAFVRACSTLWISCYPRQPSTKSKHCDAL